MMNGTHEQKNIVPVTPAVNIVETPVSFVVTLDIPGAAKELIKANIENNTLAIVADVVDATASAAGAPAKQYRRDFSLANDIEINSVEAQYELGVLTITLKKKQQYVPKQITIN
jgi:HSP20 family protein